MNGEQLYQAILADDLATLQQELTLDPMLIEYEAEDGVPLCFLAARHGSMAVLRYLLDYAIRVNLYSEDAQGRDMLQHAAMSGDVEKCRYLVERGGLNSLHGDRNLETSFDVAHRLGHAELESYFAAMVGAPWEMTYHNPIRTGFFPDPSIVRVGEDYYMVNSTFTFFPCIPVSHSRDLVNWQVIGHAIEKPEWAPLEGLEDGRGWWTPDISYWGGRSSSAAATPSRSPRRTGDGTSSTSAGARWGGKWTMLGRETALDPFRWSPDGWPVMNEDCGPSEQNLLPFPPCPMAKRTDWMTPRPPQTAQQIVCQGSSVAICGSQHPMTDVRCRSILLRRQTSFRFHFAATLTVPIHGEAGVSCYYDEHSLFAAGIRLMEDGWCLCVQEQIGLNSRTALEQPVTLQRGEAVHISVHTEGLTRRLCWTLPDGGEVHHQLDNVTCLSDEGVRLGKRFTGAMVGMYAVGGNCAVFDQISYRDESLPAYQ